MPKYIANEFLIDNGAIVEPEQEVELTEEQAERLGERVSPVKKSKKDDK